MKSLLRDRTDSTSQRGVKAPASGASSSFRFLGEKVALGECRSFLLPVSESYSGATLSIPVVVWRGDEPGPTVFLSGALHGDEINGTGVIRSLIVDPPFELERGSLLLCPVINILGFERHSRYLPDRRDLNRCFPGSASGSLASRYAHNVFTAIVEGSDYGIDFHTGAVRRTNFPNVRADLSEPRVAAIAKVFGCELVVNSKGPQGALRRAACEAGCPTIVLEAGEVWKVEPSYGEVALRGIHNVLIDLEMIAGTPKRAPYQARIDRTKWLRADTGGMLQFHVSPGELVERDQSLATCSNLIGAEQSVLKAPVGGVVMGMTTLPAVKPGDPVCHLAIPKRGMGPIRRALEAAPESLGERVREDLATNVTVEEAVDGE